MLLFGLMAAVCIIGIVHYERQIADFERDGYVTDAIVVSKETQRIKGSSPRSPYVRWYYLTVMYTDRTTDTAVTRTISTTCRAAKRKQPDSTVSIVVTDGIPMLKEEQPRKPQVYFLELMLIISSVIVIADIATRLV